MGKVVNFFENTFEAGRNIVETIVDTVSDIFKPERPRSSGPRLTYEKQKKWDEKKSDLDQKRASLETERNKYSKDSNRLESVQRRKADLESRIQAAKERLDSVRKQQCEMEEFRNNQQKSDAVSAVQALWEKEGNNAMDRLKENCPRLEELASDMAEMYNKVIEEQTAESLNRLETYRTEQKAKRLAKIKDHQQAKENRDKLLLIIQKLEQIQQKTR